MPLDPITDSTATWIIVPPQDPKQSGTSDVKSGAPGEASDGTPYESW
jgi:general secretion pathway protein G